MNLLLPSFLDHVPRIFLLIWTNYINFIRPNTKRGIYVLVIYTFCRIPVIILNGASTFILRVNAYIELRYLAKFPFCSLLSFFNFETIETHYPLQVAERNGPHSFCSQLINLNIYFQPPNT